MSWVQNRLLRMGRRDLSSDIIAFCCGALENEFIAGQYRITAGRRSRYKSCSQTIHTVHRVRACTYCQQPLWSQCSNCTALAACITLTTAGRNSYSSSVHEQQTDTLALSTNTGFQVWQCGSNTQKHKLSHGTTAQPGMTKIRHVFMYTIDMQTVAATASLEMRVRHGVRSPESRQEDSPHHRVPEPPIAVSISSRAATISGKLGRDAAAGAQQACPATHSTSAPQVGHSALQVTFPASIM